MSLKTSSNIRFSPLFQQHQEPLQQLNVRTWSEWRNSNTTMVQTQRTLTKSACVRVSEGLGQCQPEDLHVCMCVCVWEQVDIMCISGRCRLMAVSVPRIWIIHPMGGLHVPLKALPDWLIRLQRPPVLPGSSAQGWIEQCLPVCVFLDAVWSADRQTVPSWIIHQFCFYLH